MIFLLSLHGEDVLNKRERDRERGKVDISIISAWSGSRRKLKESRRVFAISARNGSNIKIKLNAGQTKKQGYSIWSSMKTCIKVNNAVV